MNVVNRLPVSKPTGTGLSACPRCTYGQRLLSVFSLPASQSVSFRRLAMLHLLWLQPSMLARLALLFMMTLWCLHLLNLIQ